LIWYKLELKCSKEDSELIEQILIEYGSISISLSSENNNDILFEKSIGEIPLWDRIEISALFQDKISLKSIYQVLDNCKFSHLVISSFKDKDWVKNFRNNLKVIKFENKLGIYPLDLVDEPIEELRQKVYMEPGLAFGSGSHETTSLCLDYLVNQNLLNKQVIDYGCGSGILAISALKLGAAHAYAIDIDSQAILVTKKNAKRNNVNNLISAGLPEIFPEIKGDIVVANILLGPIIDLKDKFLSIIKPKGKLVLTGFLSSQIESIKKIYGEEFKLKTIKQKNNRALVEFSLRRDIN